MVAFSITGFCKFDVKPLGPVQLHDVAYPPLSYKFNVLPTQTGELLDARAMHPPLLFIKKLEGFSLEIPSKNFTSARLLSGVSAETCKPGFIKNIDVINIKKG